jgi:ABC-type polysaccharide/polyol phosphate transport system ATPase subunit
MTESGIVFEHVWKKFRRGEVHDSLRDLIPALARRLLGRTPNDPAALHGREFWALSDVSFTVRPGEALGIIGANGAGKSTVLKTLNRIIRPTRGWFEVRGRIGSLIEVSAGFHQDLTGRQNVFLQGAIMGMRSAEIARKFDQIVDFAGIGDFIDTPVKRYSSGMNARLGFAIAAHLDPEVLIIDEVLAVGDLAFQDRAFGRIQEMVRSGIPVVIVSHQLDRLATLCTQAMLLDKGRVVQHGAPDDVIAAYTMASAHFADAGVDRSAPVRIEELRILSDLPVRSGDRLTYRVRGVVADGVTPIYDPFQIRVRSAQTGKVVFTTLGANCGLEPPAPGRFEAEVTLRLNVPPGIYSLETVVKDVTHPREVAKGPLAFVQVAGGPTFVGTVQMSAEMRAVYTPPDPARYEAAGASTSATVA